MYSTSRPPSYAPTPYSYTPTSSLSAKISLDEEVKVADSAAERDLVDYLAEIYSIIRTLDGLEKAYVKDAVTETEYTEMCSKLLKQYKSALAHDTVASEFVDLDTFVRRWGIECPRAIERIRIGMPSTVEQPSLLHQHHNNANNSSVAGGGGAAASSRLIVDATENFITFLDALKLNMSSKETLHPLLSDVIQSVNEVTKGDFDHRAKIIQWLITLNKMRTTEELNEEQIRELTFDMEQAYSGFKGTIY